MPVCSTGISGTRTGASASIVVDAAYVQSLLPAGLAWLYPYLPWMHGLQIGDVGAFCSVDPPTWTVPTGPQIYAFISGGPLSQAQTVDQFIQDITRAYLWYNLCECKSVATPAPPSAPSAPSNLPGVNPGGVVSISPAACALYSWSQFTDTTGYNAVPHLTVPSSAVTVDVTVTGGVDGVNVAVPDRIFCDVFLLDASNATLAHYVDGPSSLAHGWNQTLNHPVPGGTAFVTVNVRWDGGSNSGTISGAVAFNCTTFGTPSSGVQQCCSATDPITRATLQSILDMVTLIQRQTVPFAYISGPLHSGLTGTGTISVQGILGVLLNVSVPARAGQVSGTPDTVFDCGWINFGTADGYADRQFITSDSQVIFPAAAGAWTIVAYTFLQGVTVSITELIREP
jgi:hypothetical protein